MVGPTDVSAPEIACIRVRVVFEFVVTRRAPISNWSWEATLVTYPSNIVGSFAAFAATEGKTRQRAINKERVGMDVGHDSMRTVEPEH